MGGGSYREDGWPDPGRMGFGMMAYGISKLASIVLTELQQKQLASDADRPGILANSVGTLLDGRLRGNVLNSARSVRASWTRTCRIIWARSRWRKELIPSSSSRC